MLHLFRLIASKRRQSNRCNIEGRLDYSGQKPARQRAKKTAKPFQHRGLEWFPWRLFYRCNFWDSMPLNLLPLFKEKTQFKTLVFGLKSRFCALKSTDSVVARRAYLFSLPLTPCTTTVFQTHYFFTSSKISSFPPQGLCTCCFLCLGCSFPDSLHEKLLLSLRPPLISSSERSGHANVIPHFLLAPCFLHGTSHNLYLSHVFAGLSGLLFIWSVSIIRNSHMRIRT